MRRKFKKIKLERILGAKLQFYILIVFYKRYCSNDDQNFQFTNRLTKKECNRISELAQLEMYKHKLNFQSLIFFN